MDMEIWIEEVHKLEKFSAKKKKKKYTYNVQKSNCHFRFVINKIVTLCICILRIF